LIGKTLNIDKIYFNDKNNEKVIIIIKNQKGEKEDGKGKGSNGNSSFSSNDGSKFGLV